MVLRFQPLTNLLHMEGRSFIMADTDAVRADINGDDVGMRVACVDMAVDERGLVSEVDGFKECSGDPAHLLVGQLIMGMKVYGKVYSAGMGVLIADRAVAEALELIIEL